MTKSELIDYLAARHDHLPTQAVEAAVKCMIEQMSQALSSAERIEIRGFGSFSLDRRPPKIARNPKTGETDFTLSKTLIFRRWSPQRLERLKMPYPISRNCPRKAMSGNPSVDEFCEVWAQGVAWIRHGSRHLDTYLSAYTRPPSCGQDRFVQFWCLWRLCKPRHDKAGFADARHFGSFCPVF